MRARDREKVEEGRKRKVCGEDGMKKVGRLICGEQVGDIK